MKKRQEGSAMIVVMCVMIMMVMLALTLLLVSSVMVNNAIRSNQKEQCRITAVSVSNVLIEKIKGFSYTGYPDPFPSNIEDGLEAKLKTVLTTEWYSYDKQASSVDQILKRDKDYFTYELTESQLPGTTILELYWIDESENQIKDLDTSDPVEAAKLFQSLRLYVKVTNTVGEESSTIISCFTPLVDKKLIEDSEQDEEKEKFEWGQWTWQYEGHEWERGDS